MTTMKTPGVYIVEKNAFPNSVVEVATAVPAFIGYTERADNGGDSLHLKPWRISSMAEFRNYFGGMFQPKFKITDVTPAPAAEAEPASAPAEEGGDQPAAAAAPSAPAVQADVTKSFSYTMTKDGKPVLKDGKPVVKDYLIEWENVKKQHILYQSMLMFFQNGGGPCYVVSVGGFDSEVSAKDLTKGIDELVKESEPTMVVVPEAVTLDSAGYKNVLASSVSHCATMQSRIAILDVFKGYRDRRDPTEPESDHRFLGQGVATDDCIDNFRMDAGANSLDFATAYYPWVNSTVISDAELDFQNFSADMVKKVIIEDLQLPEQAPTEVPTNAEGSTDEKKLAEAKKKFQYQKQIWDELEKVKDSDVTDEDKVQVRKILRNASPLYEKILKATAKTMNLLPPSSAMAGVYTMVDNSRGVWKAPANVSLNGVMSPAVNITHADQEDLNVHAQGKSINAIRNFINEGTLVWGARTLDGNSLDWRYVNVRRTMIMIEQSIATAAKAFVFEDNVSKTWVTIKSMIQNFLTGVWKRGGLAGSSPADAFSVSVGLGETMTAVDILEGRMNITVLVAVTRPAEFIEITFQQQMQKS
ncbi:phage tail sheath C-terminal domain-containing protein [Reinekea sp. G2M2-21]|uniref:phage tail sheath family protein n=1 Tax=Reinekea sp. G2M2-21 TaxID=2788942 RepID=UPI0018AB4933|nr:phage tail sheath C-terminal domain-containing protein [Reinekea sp. G2M2-21]